MQWPKAAKGEKLFPSWTLPHDPYDTGTAFSNADVGKTVSITGNHVLVGDKDRKIHWGDAKHANIQGIIKSVDMMYKGKVELEDGQVFENGGNGVGQTEWRASYKPACTESQPDSAGV